MFASILIIAFSLALLVYWFRYSCVILLRNQAASVSNTADQRFRIAEVQERLRTPLGASSELDPLHQSLNRDYQVLTYLIEHAAGLELQTLEDRLLVLDYRIMKGWYRLMRIAAPQQARQALSEMASVLGVLAGKISERAGIQSEA